MSFFRIEKLHSTFTNCYSLLNRILYYLVTKGIDAGCKVMIEEFQQWSRRNAKTCKTDK